MVKKMLLLAGGVRVLGVRGALGALGVLGVLGAVGALDAQAPRVRPTLIAGRVVEDGAGVADAAVHVVWLAQPELPGSLLYAVDPQPRRTLRARSKDGGRFRIGLPHGGTFAVYATHGTRRSAFVFPVSPGDFLELTLQPIPSVTGRVTDAQGRPVAGANVSAAPFLDLSWSAEKYRHPKTVDVVQTDAAGRYRLPVWAKPYRAAFDHRSLRAWTDTLVSADRFYRVDGQTSGDFALRLTRPAVVSGRVVGPQGQPLAATVTDPETGRTVQADPRGGFTFRAAHAALVVHADGFQRLRVPAGGARSKQLLLRVQPGLRWTMRLVRDGKPLAERSVVLASPVGGVRGHVPWVARTGADGRLVVAGLSPRSPLSAFVAVGGRFREFLSCVPVADRDLGDVTVGARRIAGRVMGVERQPLAGVRVMLQPVLAADARAPAPAQLRPLPRVTYTDRAGRFRFDGVLPGLLRLGVNAGADGMLQRVLAATVDARGTDGEPLLVQMVAGRTVAGTVLMPGGKPAAGARVQYVVSGSDWMGEGSCYLRTLADGDGRFRFRGLPQSGSFTSYAKFATADGTGYWSMLSSRPSSPRASGSAGQPLVHKLSRHPGRYQ